jgi:hypothetical protein
MADIFHMSGRLTRRQLMIQWIGVLIAVAGFVYTGVKDYQKGDIKIPSLPQKEVLTKPVYPIQYCLMAYDPNVDRVFYLHDNGQWHDYAPQQRRYEATPQHGQNQDQAALGTVNGSPGGSRGYHYGQQAQAYAYPKRY